MNKELGRHLIVDLCDCNVEAIKYVRSVERALVQAAHACSASLLDQTFHQFSPVGVSGVVLIAESHLSVHTWPEEKYAAIDIFTCSNEMDMNKALRVLEQAFEAREIWVTQVSRGTWPGMNLSTEHRIDQR